MAVRLIPGNQSRKTCYRRWSVHHQRLCIELLDYVWIVAHFPALGGVTGALALPPVFSVALASSILFFPDSSRRLLRVGQIYRARSEVDRIRGIDIDDDDIVREVASIEFSLEETTREATSMKDIFRTKDGKLFYRFMLCVGLQFWIQMTGARVIGTYSTTIFQSNLNL